MRSFQFGRWTEIRLVYHKNKRLTLRLPLVILQINHPVFGSALRVSGSTSFIVNLLPGTEEYRAQNGSFYFQITLFGFGIELQI